MPSRWKKWFQSALSRLRRLAMVIGIIGAAQLLLGLIAWLLLFRTHPQGLSMGLSLIGFGSWAIAAVLSLGGRRPGARPMGMGSMFGGMPALSLSNLETSKPESHDAKPDLSRGGDLLFVASLIPLAIAFTLRLQADLSAGRTWQDIFPPVE